MKIGTKFNMRKEMVEGDNYLGIQIHRFYWKCKRCSGELTMKTDPKNSDYVCEYGATRNYEPWRDQRAAETANSARRKLEESNDIMKSLENKTYDSKREIDILDNLEEVRHMNKRLANVNHEEMIQASRKKYLEALQEDVLQRDAKEAFGRLCKRRVDTLEQEDNQKYDSESDEESGIAGIINVKKREMKEQIKPMPSGLGQKNVFKKPALKVKKKEVDSVPSNPLDMLAGMGTDSDSD